jgi:hypothetical protein
MQFQIIIYIAFLILTGLAYGLLSPLAGQAKIDLRIVYHGARRENMKHIISFIGSILVFGIFFVFSPATAEERVKVLEMGESGQTIEFLMTPEEIAAENAEKKRLAAIREPKLKKPIKRVKIFEMGDSGQTVEFEMTPKEIAVEEAGKARLVAIREAKAKKPKKPVIGFELAESGVIIEFPVTSFEISKEK